MRCLPNMTVLVPCDLVETKKATIAAADYNGPVYIRYGRENVPIITEEKTEFKIGKAIKMKEGKDVCIMACGSMVYESLMSAEILEKEGIKARVLNIHTIKPIDKQAIIEAAKDCGAIVTAEEHQIFGGFGSAVAEVVVANCPVPMEFVGVNDTFGESGNPADLIVKYGLKDVNIVQAVKKVLKRK